MTAPNILENGLKRRTNGGGSSSHVRSSYVPTPAATVKILQGGIESEPRGSSFDDECYATHVIDTDT